MVDAGKANADKANTDKAKNPRVTRYLNQISLEEAIATVKSSFARPDGEKNRETVPLLDACGRISAQSLRAGYSVPPANVSAMDGIAVKSAETVGANEQLPVKLTNYLRVNTGNHVPPEYDAVIMIEDTWTDWDDGILVRKAARPWQNVRAAGEDIKKGDLIIPAGHKIRPFDCGALGTYGFSEIPVHKITAGLIPTGSELIKIGEIPKPGQVVESNIPMAAIWLKERHVKPVIYPMTPDEPEKIRDAILKAVDENDIVIVSAGSSAGTKDFTGSVIAELGELIFHGIGIMPGKPMILGRIKDKPIIGLPGYPISAQVVLREVVGPLLDSWGYTGFDCGRADAVLTADLSSNVGFDEFVLLSVAKKGDVYYAAQQSRGAGVQTATLKSNAYLRIPAQLEGYSAGESVSVCLTQPLEYADRSLLVIGMTDPALGALSELLRDKGVILHIYNSGNMGGVIALKKDICHCAPLHSLSPDGGYNTAAVKRYLPQTRVHLIAAAGIEYGFAMRKSMPLEETLKALTDGELIFASQPKDSESELILRKLLVDRELCEKDAFSDNLKRPDIIFAGEMAAAVSVVNGRCGCCFVPRSIAKSCGLEFVAADFARYELAIRDTEMADKRIQTLIDVISSDEYKERLNTMGGYDASVAGEETIIE